MRRVKSAALARRLGMKVLCYWCFYIYPSDTQRGVSQSRDGEKGPEGQAAAFPLSTYFEGGNRPSLTPGESGCLA